MSYIPPLVCDTPPPIDFEDSHEDDFGDGMFSNYDGSSLPTTPKQLSSVNDHDLPLDIPELPDVPDVPHFPHITTNDLAKNANVKDSLDISPTNAATVQQSSHIYCDNESPQPPPIICTRKVDNETPKIDDVEPSLQPKNSVDQSAQDVCKISPQSMENSLSSPSNDNVCRSESPPSLVFSAESLNCDDNQSEEFEDFHQNSDDVECNFPSLKLDSASDTKSQSSDLDEALNLQECEIDEIKENCEIINTRQSNSNVDVESIENVAAQSSNVDELNVTSATHADDSFDDFVEYECNVVAAAEKCDFEQQQQAVVVETSFNEFTESKSSTDENAFAADFSQFETYSENISTETDQRNTIEQHESGFVSSLDQLTAEKLSAVTETKDDFDDFNDADDDDEFGEFNDFSDFSQSQPFASTLTANIEELSAKIKPLLDSLFPFSDGESEDSSYDALDLTNDNTRIIRDFENSKALDHQWTNSVGKNSLVTALGIDSRNILYGGKWNSSMPRFAANLGFSPLEPMKPSASGPSSNSAVTNEIPAAQFDWNSSGLTNPLDGVQEILHKTNSAENQSSRAALDWNSTKAEPTLIASTVPLPNIHPTLKNINATNFIDSEESTQTTASYVVPGSGTLKETHIFTPSKSPFSIPQSRDVQCDKLETKCPDFDYDKAAAGIIIDENVVKKEYRDIEYDPDKPTTTSTLSNSDDFSDFQSVPIPMTGPNPQKSTQNILSIDFGILQPTKRKTNITINWPDPGNVATSTHLESFDSFKSIENMMSSSPSDFGTSEKAKSSSSSFGDFAKPVIGVSPSEVMFETTSVRSEDEFSDFQSVEPTTSHNPVPDVIPTYNDLTPSNKLEMFAENISDGNAIITSESTSTNWTNFQSLKLNEPPTPTNVPLTNFLQPEPLQPSQILTPQPVNPQPSLQTNSIWPESEIDPDEIARLEAIFPQARKPSLQSDTSDAQIAKSQNLNSSKLQEDDEWSDFVSVPTPATQSLPITNIISANIVKHQQDDDEWSDFVSSTTQPLSIPQQWSTNSGPNFTSWNAPPQFDSWQSSTLFQQPQQFVSTPTINNNPSLISNQAAKTNPNSFFSQKAPSISLIPDLGFVAPKTLVNRSRTNYQSK